MDGFTVPASRSTRRTFAPGEPGPEPVTFALLDEDARQLFAALLGVLDAGTGRAVSLDSFPERCAVLAATCQLATALRGRS